MNLKSQLSYTSYVINMNPKWRSKSDVIPIFTSLAYTYGPSLIFIRLQKVQLCYLTNVSDFAMITLH